LLERTKDLLQNKGKIYTPFSLFCAFFAIYFHAKPLIYIFFAENLSDRITGIDQLITADPVQWIKHISIVIAFSLALTIVYGAGQAISAIIWGTFNKVNKYISYALEKSKFVPRSELEATIVLYDDISEQLTRKENSLGTLRQTQENSEILYKTNMDKHAKNSGKQEKQITDLRQSLDEASNHGQFHVEYIRAGQTPLTERLTIERLMQDKDMAIAVNYLLSQYTNDFDLDISPPIYSTRKVSPNLGKLFGSLEALNFGKLKFNNNETVKFDLDEKTLAILKRLVSNDTVYSQAPAHYGTPVPA